MLHSFGLTALQHFTSLVKKNLNNSAIQIFYPYTIHIFNVASKRVSNFLCVKSCFFSHNLDSLFSNKINLNTRLFIYLYVSVLCYSSEKHLRTRRKAPGRLQRQINGVCAPLQLLQDHSKDQQRSSHGNEQYILRSESRTYKSTKSVYLRYTGDCEGAWRQWDPVLRSGRGWGSGW